MTPQTISSATVLTLGNKVVLYCTVLYCRKYREERGLTVQCSSPTVDFLVSLVLECMMVVLYWEVPGRETTVII